MKAHTIRIWEQRYNLISPQRTGTNIRFYTDEEVKRLLKVSALYHQGMKISKIASMSESEINEYIQNIELHTGNEHVALEKLTIAMIDLNEEQFLSVFNPCIAERGFKNTMIQLIYPFLQKVGVMWQVGDVHPAQEHFISNLIRQKLISAIDQLYKPKTETDPKIILFLPEGELHELGLLFYSYLLQEMNYHVIYLGQSVPSQDLAKVAEKYHCQLFVSSIINPAAVDSFSQTLSLLQTTLGPGIKLYVAGSQLDHLASPSIHKIPNIQEFIQAFNHSV
ncbi:MAG: MerR family transcriptional regulator [Chitinophagaceae bacterium]|nr:MerR family transcriptional regulator [Chitinophagaceae bacterium]